MSGRHLICPHFRNIRLLLRTGVTSVSVLRLSSRCHSNVPWVLLSTVMDKREVQSSFGGSHYVERQWRSVLGTGYSKGRKCSSCKKIFLRHGTNVKGLFGLNSGCPQTRTTVDFTTPYKERRNLREGSNGYLEEMINSLLLNLKNSFNEKLTTGTQNDPP